MLPKSLIGAPSKDTIHQESRVSDRLGEGNVMSSINRSLQHSSVTIAVDVSETTSTRGVILAPAKKHGKPNASLSAVLEVLASIRFLIRKTHPSLDF